MISPDKAFWGHGYTAGKKAEQERIIAIAQNLICFDHQNGCEHSACYALTHLIEAIKKQDQAND